MTADVQTFPLAIVTAMAVKRTPLEHAVGIAKPMWTPMAFATMSILVWVNWTLVAFAMALERFTTVDVRTFPMAIVTAMAISWMPWVYVAEIAWVIPMEMGCVTPMKCQDAPTQHRATTTPMPPTRTEAVKWKMPWVCAVVIAQPTSMATAFATPTTSLAALSPALVTTTPVPT